MEKYFKYLNYIIFILLLVFAYFKIKDNNKYAQKIPILTFHRLVEDDVKNTKYKDNEWVGSISVFEEMMKYLKDNDYKTISTEEFYEWYKGKIKLPKKTVLITIDDGFYEDYYFVYPIIKKYNFKATSFVVGIRTKDVTEKYDPNKESYLGLDVIKKIQEEYPNYEFQSHSYNMHYYTKDGKHRIKSMSYDDIEKDMQEMQKFNFTTMAYPFGDFNSDLQELAHKYGYLVGFRFAHSDYARKSNNQYEIFRIKINGAAKLEDLKKWLSY